MRYVNLLVIHRTEAGRTGQEVARCENGAYHLFVRQDGQVDWALGGGFGLGFELRGAHAVGYNSQSIGIAVYGCFDPCPDGKPGPLPHNLHPTQAQLDALELLCLGLCWWFGRKLYLAGHTELRGATRYPGKVCPGRNLDMCALREKTGCPTFPVS
jgi:hypothetical protein